MNDGGLTERWSYLSGHMLDRRFSFSSNHSLCHLISFFFFLLQRQLVIRPMEANRHVYMWVIINVQYYIPTV